MLNSKWEENIRVSVTAVTEQKETEKSQKAHCSSLPSLELACPQMGTVALFPGKKNSRGKTSSNFFFPCYAPYHRHPAGMNNH